MRKSFENFELDVSFSVKENEFISILGPSGSGKTTTLHIIEGFVNPDSGKIIKNGEDITSLPPSKRKMGIVFQDYALFPYLNVFNNIAFGLKVKGMGSKEVKQKVIGIAEKMDILKIIYKHPDQLSGGEKQRVALARAMIVEPDILLMDEPLSSLDAKIRAELMEELKIFHRQTNATIVYITHDQSEAMYLSDRIILINNGKIDQVDTPIALYKRPKTSFAKAFIGKMNRLDLGGKEIYIRPEEIVIGKGGELVGIIKETVFLEGVAEIKVDMNGKEILIRELVRKVEHFKVGDKIYFSIERR